MNFSQTQHHMGTEVEISIFDTTVPQEKIKSDIKSAFQIFQNMQQEFSRFQEDSCLTKLNEKKSAEVSDIFLEVLQKSQYFFELTGGYFNPLVSLESIGYNQTFSQLPKERKEYSFSPTEEYDFQNIRIEDHTVQLKAEHNLDFGGIVKGYTVDTVRDFFWEQGYKNFLINEGGDIYMSGKCEEDVSCTVGIDNPFDETQLIATFDIENMATATSGTYKRNWKIGEKKYHHIINPHSGENPHDIVSLTLVTRDCITSDVLATTGIAMGERQALDFFSREKIPVFMVTADKRYVSNCFWETYNLEILASHPSVGSI